jgi:hypothetical protein
MARKIVRTRPGDAPPRPKYSSRPSARSARKDRSTRASWAEAVKSREMYFATYQAIAKDERRPGLDKDFYQPLFHGIKINLLGTGNDDAAHLWVHLSSFQYLGSEP